MLAHEMGLKLGRVESGHFLSICSMFVPAFLVDRTSFGGKLFDSDVVFNSPLGEILSAGYGLFSVHISLLCILVKNIPQRLLGVLPFLISVTS